MMDVNIFLLTLLLVAILGVRGQNRKIMVFNAANFSAIRDKINGVYIAKFKKITDNYLNGTAMKKLCVNDLVNCAGECIQAEKCASFNFGKLPNCNGRHECKILHEELVNKTKSLNHRQEYDYFSLNVSTDLRNVLFYQLLENYTELV